MGNPRKGLAHRFPLGEFAEHGAIDRLHDAQDILLLDEAHLKVELVEFAVEAIGARVFIAKAWRDLEIAIETRHHDELLILLGRLRQRVELARMQARGHQEITRPFRRRGGQDRRLELEEALAFHMATD